jgi:hypothetical protein
MRDGEIAGENMLAGPKTITNFAGRAGSEGG